MKFAIALLGTNLLGYACVFCIFWRQQKTFFMKWLTFLGHFWNSVVSMVHFKTVKRIKKIFKSNMPNTHVLMPTLRGRNRVAMGWGH